MSVDSTNWHLIHILINISTDTSSTLDWHLNWQSIESQVIFAHMPSSVDWYISISQISTTADGASIKCWSRCWPSINLVSTKYWLRCRMNVAWDVDWVSIKEIDWHLTTHAFRTDDSSQAAFFLPWFYMKLIILGDTCTVLCKRQRWKSITTWSWFKQDIIENPVFPFNWCSCDCSKSFTSQW